MPLDTGCVTPTPRSAAIAPSAALPPFASTSIAMRTAVGFSAATAYLCAFGAGGAVTSADAEAVAEADAVAVTDGVTVAVVAFSGPPAGGVALQAIGEAATRIAPAESARAEESSRDTFTVAGRMPLLHGAS